jgi:uncharacterized RDD family membrane protein YckC
MADLTILVVYSWGMHKFLYDVIQIQPNQWFYVAGSLQGIHIAADILCVSMPMLLYALVTEIVLNGQTFGKKIFGIRVMSMEGGSPTISQYLLRWVTRFFEWPLVFGFVIPQTGIFFQVALVGFIGIFVVIIIAISKSGQRLGDLGAGTVVVDTKIKTQLHETVFLEINQQDYQVTFPDVMKLSDRDINTIKSILDIATRKGDIQLAASAAEKIKNHLQIETGLPPFEFLELLMRDYNYLSVR